MIGTWWNKLTRRKARRQRGRPAPARRAPVQPRLEALENRLAPAAHQWTGAASTLWSNASNWVGGSPAGDANAVLIFPSTPTRFTSTNNLGNIPVSEIQIFGSGYTISSSSALSRIEL